MHVTEVPLHTFHSLHNFNQRKGDFRKNLEESLFDQYYLWRAMHKGLLWIITSDSWQQGKDWLIMLLHTMQEMVGRVKWRSILMKIFDWQIYLQPYTLWFTQLRTLLQINLLPCKGMLTHFPTVPNEILDPRVTLICLSLELPKPMSAAWYLPQINTTLKGLKAQYNYLGNTSCHITCHW